MLGEVWDVKTFVTGLEAFPTGRGSLLERLSINCQFFDHLELAIKEGVMEMVYPVIHLIVDVNDRSIGSNTEP